MDLRTKNERNGAPDIEIPGTVYHALDFFQGEDDGQATGSAEQLQQMQSKEQVDRKMKQLYASFVVSTGARQKMYELLQLLLNTEEGSTLIHCFAGKDRTGISAAVILTILGASKDDIAADYLKTNQLRKKENEELLGQLRAAAKVPESMLEAVHEALCVRREYLETSYEAAEQKYGSFERYILEGIGFGQEEMGAAAGHVSGMKPFHGSGLNTEITTVTVQPRHSQRRTGVLTAVTPLLCSFTGARRI